MIQRTSLIPLAEQEKIIDIYLAKGSCNRVKRLIKSLKDQRIQEIAILHLKNEVPSCAAEGAIIGGVIGAVIANIPGSIGGALIGASIGTAIGIKYTIVKVEQEDHFRNWLGQAINDNTYCFFEEFVEQDEDMRDLVDQYFTFDYPKYPVLAPDQQIYEKEEIEKWLKSKPEEAFNSPIRGINFEVKDLTYYPQQFLRIINRMKEIRKRKLLTMSPTDIRARGFEALHKEVCIKFCNILGSSIKCTTIQGYSQNMGGQQIKQRVLNLIEQIPFPDSLVEDIPYLGNF